MSFRFLILCSFLSSSLAFAQLENHPMLGAGSWRVGSLVFSAIQPEGNFNAARANCRGFHNLVDLPTTGQATAYIQSANKPIYDQDSLWTQTWDEHRGPIVYRESEGIRAWTNPNHTHFYRCVIDESNPAYPRPILDPPAPIQAPAPVAMALPFSSLITFQDGSQYEIKITGQAADELNYRSNRESPWQLIPLSGKVAHIPVMRLSRPNLPIPGVAVGNIYDENRLPSIAWVTLEGSKVVMLFAGKAIPIDFQMSRNNFNTPTIINQRGLDYIVFSYSNIENTQSGTVAQKLSGPHNWIKVDNIYRNNPLQYRIANGNLYLDRPNSNGASTRVDLENLRVTELLRDYIGFCVGQYPYQCRKIERSRALMYPSSKLGKIASGSETPAILKTEYENTEVDYQRQEVHYYHVPNVTEVSLFDSILSLVTKHTPNDLPLDQAKKAMSLATSLGFSAEFADRLICPSGYAFIPFVLNKDSEDSMFYQFVREKHLYDFCIMRTAAGTTHNTYKVNVTLDEAKTSCESFGEGYFLENDNEWAAVAALITRTPENWNSRAVDIGILSRGNSDSNQSFLHAWGNNDLAQNSLPYYGTGFNGDHTHKRTFNLPTGSKLWDIAGNLWQILSPGRRRPELTRTLKIKAELFGKPSSLNKNYVLLDDQVRNGSEYTLLREFFADRYRSPNYDLRNYGSILFETGLIKKPTEEITWARGGAYNSGRWAGIYSMISLDKNLRYSNVGFRCVYYLDNTERKLRDLR